MHWGCILQDDFFFFFHSVFLSSSFLAVPKSPSGHFWQQLNTEVTFSNYSKWLQDFSPEQCWSQCTYSWRYFPPHALVVIHHHWISSWFTTSFCRSSLLASVLSPLSNAASSANFATSLVLLSWVICEYSEQRIWKLFPLGKLIVQFVSWW